MLLSSIIVFMLASGFVQGDWSYSPSGYATMTHYTQPIDYVGSCGCAPDSTHYPTVALSQLAFGSAEAYGPACGYCFQLTLLNTFLSDPPFYPDEHPSVVVKVTDLCPITSDWCTATENQPNAAGHFLNFDLSFPSPAIPSDFFPSNVTEYGYSDFGVWNVSYQTVPCTPNWAGSGDSSAMGSVANLGDSACCPGNPSANLTCPSFSEQNGIPPDTAINFADKVLQPLFLLVAALVLQGLFISPRI